MGIVIRHSAIINSRSVRSNSSHMSGMSSYNTCKCNTFVSSIVRDENLNNSSSIDTGSHHANVDSRSRSTRNLA